MIWFWWIALFSASCLYPPFILPFILLLVLAPPKYDPAIRFKEMMDEHRDSDDA